MPLIAIVNFGTGNLRSVQKAIERVGDRSVRVAVTDDPRQLERADRAVLPGQGAIGTCLDAIDEKGLGDVLDTMLQTKPLLGICLGLQIMYEYSQEGGGVECIGALSGQVTRFNDGTEGEMVDSVTGARLKVPHMGWNNVAQTRPHPMWHDIDSGERFYFVHSYCAHATKPAEEFGTADYGGTFTAAGGKDNFFGVQFHPEKSQQAGLKLIRNFVTWDGSS